MVLLYQHWGWVAWVCRWAMERPMIQIPGSKKISYLEENLGALNVKLSQEEMRLLNDIFPINVAMGDKYPDQFKCEA
jgi:diketogulonate reductase-like aldo/keto reductase